MANGKEAWRPFLDEYSPFILRCVRRLSSDYDERMEIYSHVCERLWVDDCRRIKQFRGRGDAGECKFTTWLAAVCLNLGREWIRRTRGRRRLYRPIKALDPATQAVFKLHYWDGYTAREISAMGGSENETPQQIERALATIRACLTRDHRWRLVRSGLRHVSPVPIDPVAAEGHVAPVAARASAADNRTADRRATEVLRAAIKTLPHPQRRALVLRYREGMSARQIAREMEISNYKRVYELQAKAIVVLRAALEAAGVSLGDFDFSQSDLLR